MEDNSDVRRSSAAATCGSMSEPSPTLQGRYAVLNRRLTEVIRHCGEVRLPNVAVRPELCHVIEPGRGALTAPHRHPFTELTWIEGAGMDYRRSLRRVRVNPGMVFLMPAMAMHAWEARGAGSILHGFMVAVRVMPGTPSHYLEELAAGIGYRFRAGHELLAALRAMERHAVSPAPGSAAIAAGYMRAVLGLAFQRLGRLRAGAAPPAPAPGLSASEQAFLRARDYLLARLHQDPPLPDVARVAGTTTRHLNRLFVARLGMPAGAFMRRVRIDRARHMLHEPGARVKAVARDCGFCDPAYFARAFRLQVGMAPSAYARSLT